ncbi:AMP-binding protein [Amycolatopsis anabasis]|uniref:AMP-binding protein n=1 Tax=Amycolatopsis anabasis TaxID=1840409 RepID=UPI001FEA9EE0|nr:AMP-binding protein [Amycolatopsis anabasis]
MGVPMLGTTALVRNGVMRPMALSKLRRIWRKYRKWGLTVTLAFTAGAVRHPDRIAVIDDRGSITYRDLDERSTRIAHGLRSLGIGEARPRIGVLGRNHRGVVESCLAAGKLGADVVLLNTGLSARQMRSVVEEQGVDLLIVDEDLLPLTADCPGDVLQVVGWVENPSGAVAYGDRRWHTLDSLIASSPGWTLPLPGRHGRTIMLTSGTTGTPKGARRPEPRSLAPISATLDVIPFQAGEVMLLAPPLFHILAFGHLQLGALLGATFVLHRKFDPRRALDDLGQHGCTSLVAPPVMLQRMLEVPGAELSTCDSSALRIVLSGGSALPTWVANRFIERFGPVLYNVYGSTEVSWATIATPRDLIEAEGTAGRPPRGTRVAVLGDSGEVQPIGEVGRIFVGNEMLFEGYTEADAVTETQLGLMCTGDLGYFDEKGRLFIAGRADDMIISGGENVFPREVEDLLMLREDIREVAAVGVPDEEYGQRLVAYIVPEPGFEVSAGEVRAYVKRNLAKFSVPREVIFLDELPRNPAGKVITRELPDPPADLDLIPPGPRTKSSLPAHRRDAMA